MYCIESVLPTGAVPGWQEGVRWCRGAGVQCLDPMHCSENTHCGVTSQLPTQVHTYLLHADEENTLHGSYFVMCPTH